MSQYGEIKCLDILGFQNNYMQFFSCACFGVILAVYALTLPECPVSRGGEQKRLKNLWLLRICPVPIGVRVAM